jgi:hypothetical protein
LIGGLFSSGASAGGESDVFFTASGGVVAGPQVRLLGEAGPEMVLNRTDQTALAKILNVTTTSPYALMELIRGPGATLAAPAITALATGGVVDKPTLALLGEAGPEMVLNRVDQQVLAKMLQAVNPTPGALLRIIRDPASAPTVSSDAFRGLAWPGAMAAAGGVDATFLRDLGGEQPYPRIPALAAGAIISGPTLALIGEAGPEVVVPMRENGSMPWGEPSSATPVYSGPLVEVNVHADGDSNVRQEKSTGPDGRQQLDIYIEKKMEQTFGSGRMDRVMRNSYGVDRKGVRL